MDDPRLAERKAALRSAYAERRARRSDDALTRAAEQLRARARRCEAGTVAAFVPVRGEPGSVAVLDELAARARVLLPVLGRVGEPLQWAAYAGAEGLVRGPLGLLQPPAGDGSSLAEAEVVLVPAVAIGLDGSRLGHGGGFYDRALAGLASDRLVGVVHDDEVADALPMGRHDVHVGHLCTPSRMINLPHDAEARGRHVSG